MPHPICIHKFKFETSPNGLWISVGDHLEGELDRYDLGRGKL